MDCVICLDSGCEDDKNMITTPCNHKFHKECIMKWCNVKTTCPMCRECLVNIYEVKYIGNRMFLEILDNSIKLYNKNKQIYLYYTGIKYIKYNKDYNLTLEVKSKLLNDKNADKLEFIKIYSNNESLINIFKKLKNKLIK